MEQEKNKENKKKKTNKTSGRKVGKLLYSQKTNQFKLKATYILWDRVLLHTRFLIWANMACFNRFRRFFAEKKHFNLYVGNIIAHFEPKINSFILYRSNTNKPERSQCKN